MTWFLAEQRRPPVDREDGGYGMVITRGINVLDKSWSNSLAWAAPGSESIHDHDIVLLEGGVELSLAMRLLASELASEHTQR